MFNVLLHYFSRYRTRINYVPLKVLLFIASLIWFATSGYLFFEIQGKPDLKWSDALWWAIVTMTTVGYGDYFPETFWGRYLIGIPTMIFGIGLLGFILSEVASKLIESKSRRLRGMVEHNLSNHVIIVNFHNLEKVLKLIDELKSDPSSRNKDLCMIDETLEEIPLELHNLDVHFVKGNPTKEAVLQRACLASASHAIVLSKDPSNPHSDDQNLTTILMIENLNPKVITVAECIDQERKQQLKAAGCDRIVCIAPLTTNLLIQEMQDPGIQNIITELTSNVYGQQLYLVIIEKLQTWKASELAQWAQQNQVVLLGVIRGEQTHLNCKEDFEVLKHDLALILGKSRPEAVTM